MNSFSYLITPEKFKVRTDLVNMQLAPRIISDFATHSLMLAMEPWDFRLVLNPEYSDVSINQLFLNAYSTFKAYAQIMKKQGDDHTVVSLHTSYWGLEYNNNARVTTTVQLLAARLAGVDNVIFHLDQTIANASVMADAKEFVQQQNGKNMGDILANLVVQTQEANWSIGVNVKTVEQA